jgi:hypothetical protein
VGNRAESRLSASDAAGATHSTLQRSESTSRCAVARSVGAHFQTGF